MTYSLTPRRILLHGGLFLLTFFTTTIAGVGWIRPDAFELTNFVYGLPYSLSLLLFLSAHEFGHYFASRRHGVDVTLPYYIPFPPFPPLMSMFLNFGTFGAVIRTKSVVPSRKAIFDIGVAGPIAGFIVSVGLLAYGFTHLPGKEFLLSIHPDYDFAAGASPSPHGVGLAFGDTIIFSLFRHFLTHPALEYVPPMSEIYHYPFLCVGWFGLFVTALNLLPMGQFDGGHISYAMFGERHRTVSRWTFIGLIALGTPAMLDTVVRVGLGFFHRTELPVIVPLAQYSWWAWILWAMIAFYVVKLVHPPVGDETPLNPARRIIGWITLAIFVVSFAPNPIMVWE